MYVTEPRPCGDVEKVPPNPEPNAKILAFFRQIVIGLSNLSAAEKDATVREMNNMMLECEKANEENMESEESVLEKKHKHKDWLGVEKRSMKISKADFPQSSDRLNIHNCWYQVW